MGVLAHTRHLLLPQFLTMVLAAKKPAMKSSMKVSMKKSVMTSGMKKTMKKGVMKKTGMKKAKRVSIIAKGKLAKSAVFSGRKEKTTSGLKRSDLVKSKTGKVVSKKASARAKRVYANSGLKKWADACKKARKELGLKGFVAIGGKSVEGKALYAKVKSLLN